MSQELKNESLVKGAFEMQALKNIQDVLSSNVNELEALHKELASTIDATKEKKSA